MPTKTQLNKKLLDEVYDIYTQAEIDILKNIAKKQKKGNNVEGWAEWKLKDIQELREETRKALEGPNKKVKNIMSDNLLKIYKGAKTSVSSDLGVPMTAISDIVSPKLQRLILETNQLIDGTSVRILRNVDDVYREIIAQTSTGVLSGMDTREQAIQKALNKLADKGITGFVDRIGRQWEMASYVDMAIRTTTSNAALQGHVDRQIELGEDLMIVSSFGNTCPLCMPWEGVVLSISGNSLKYQSLASAKAAGLFHPNCKHTLLAYVEGITEPVKQEPEPEVYGAQQKQRYNERQIRKWKRREAVALSPKEQVTASNKVKQWQSIQRDHIKEWDLRRNYKRESIKGRVAATKVKSGVKAVVDITKLDEGTQGVIERYTTGAYKTFNSQADEYLKSGNKGTLSGNAEKLVNLVEGSNEKFDALYRIESISGFKIEGDQVVSSPFSLQDELTWGLRSTSQSQKFIGKAASGKDKNLPFVGGADLPQRTVFRIKNAKGLDVSRLSPYDQSEVIVSGKYKINSTGQIEIIGGQKVIVIDLLEATKVEPVKPVEIPLPVIKPFNPADYTFPDEGEVKKHGEYLRGPKITPEEKEGIRKYTGQFHITSNYYLRNNKQMKNNSSYSEDETKEYIKNISSGISKAPPLVKDTVLHRKVSTYDIETILGIEDKSFRALKDRALKANDKTAAAMVKSTLKGGTLSDNSFLSTTRIDSRTDIYNETIFEFYLPEGYNKGVFLESMSQFKTEKEYLLDKSQKFTIQDVEVKFGQLRIKVTPILE